MFIRVHQGSHLLKKNKDQKLSQVMMCISYHKNKRNLVISASLLNRLVNFSFQRRDMREVKNKYAVIQFFADVNYKDKPV